MGIGSISDWVSVFIAFLSLLAFVLVEKEKLTSIFNKSRLNRISKRKNPYTESRSNNPKESSEIALKQAYGQNFSTIYFIAFVVSVIFGGAFLGVASYYIYFSLVGIANGLISKTNMINSILISIDSGKVTTWIIWGMVIEAIVGIFMFYIYSWINKFIFKNFTRKS